MGGIEITDYYHIWYNKAECVDKKCLALEWVIHKWKKRGGSMKYKIITYKEMCKILFKHGYHIDRYRGSHAIFVKEGHNPVSVNNHLNPIVARRLMRENSLDLV